MGTWINNDGLKIRYGADAAKAGTGGEYSMPGSTHVVELVVEGTKLNAFGTATMLSDTVTIPNGVLLESVEFRVVEPFTSGGSATLTLGLYDTDFSTAYDANGIDATIALTAIDAVNDTIACDGALVGTVLANNTPSVVSATAGTANFTGGKGLLRIKYTVV